MLSKFRKWKKAISPIVSVLFLFGIILGAIAISLGIIYPQIQELNDNTELETSATSMLNLDTEIKTLITNGANSKVLFTVSTGTTGFFFIDTQSSINLTLWDGNSILSSFDLNHSRFSIRQGIDQNVIEPFSHSYLRGGGNQNTFFLNSSNRGEIPWTILNQSRPGFEPSVYTSLSYRNIISSTKLLNEQNLEVNVTVQIQMVDILLTDASSTSSNDPQIAINYLGTNINTIEFLDLTNNFYIKSRTLLSDPNSVPHVETNFYEERPLEDTSTFNIKLDLIYHLLEVNI